VPGVWGGILAENDNFHLIDVEISKGLEDVFREKVDPMSF